MNERIYGDILHVTPDLWKSIGFLDLYLTNRSKRYWHLSHSSFTFWSDVPARVTLTRFEEGREIGSQEWSSPLWLPMSFKFAFVYLVFLRVALFTVPRGAWIISHFSLFCAGHTWLRRLKGQWMLFWSWDLFENGGSLYYKFEKHAVSTCQYVLFISEPMARYYDARVPAGKNTIVRGILPLGVRRDPVDREPRDGQLGYIGNTRQDDGLEDVLHVMAADRSLRLDIIGRGNWDEQLASLAASLGVGDRVRFLGRIFDDAKVAGIVREWQIGVAPYRHSSYSPYGDSGKVKKYWQFGLPVVMTATMDIHREIAAMRAGEVADQGATALAQAIARIRREPAAYERGVSATRDKYEYVGLYDRGLSFMRSRS
jgi:glycosyltransferase involved in cell wall biosynthesis